MTEEIVENLPVGVIVVDRQMHVGYLNPAAEGFTGYAPLDAIGRRLPELFGPQLWSEGSAFQEAVKTGEQAAPRVTPVTKAVGCDPDDEQRLMVGVAPIGTPPREYLISLHRVSPLHQIDAERVADIAHDVRGPLASIRAYTELLVDEVDQGDPDLRRQFLQVIDQRTRHLTDLVINLISLTQWHLGRLEISKARLSLRDVAGEAVAESQAHARQRDVDLVLDAEDDPHLIAADRDALSILLGNLISNAIKFSVAGGDVIVSLRQVGEHQVVKVTDSGCGIHPEDRPHLFETFYRGRNALAAGIEGSGLGLSLVRVIVEAHGGEIAVDSNEGEGTSVTVSLPLG